MRPLITALGLAISVMTPAGVLADEALPIITNQTVISECGECHMAFQPQLLPKRSWKRMLETMANHFGEDASLGDDERRDIQAYLIANAADAGWFGEGRKMLRGVSRHDTPLRITELPRFRHKHRERKIGRLRRRHQVKSMANCKACHRGAELGYYDDD